MNDGDAFQQTHVHFKKAKDIDLEAEVIDTEKGTSLWSKWGVQYLEGEKGKILSFSKRPGFFVAPNVLDQPWQEFLAYQALTKFNQAPYATNLGPGLDGSSDEGKNLWLKWKQGYGFVSQSSTTDSRAAHIKKDPYRLEKTSWAVQGYHYDWSGRTYSTEMNSHIASCLAKLSVKLASIVPQAPVDFIPEAVICNYYGSNTVAMGGHVDDAEYALECPVVSISLGRKPCIFLVGTSTRDDPAMPVLLRPGDVVWLHGCSRRAVHSMARLLNAYHVQRSQKDPWLRLNESISEEERTRFEHFIVEDRLPLDKYLNEHRININVRQVYRHG